MRSIPILSKGTCISGRGRKGAFGEAGGFTNWHSRQAAHHRRTFSWMPGQKNRAIKRFSVAAWPRCPAIGLQWAAWKSISRRLFGTNNLLSDQLKQVRTLRVLCTSTLSVASAITLCVRSGCLSRHRPCARVSTPSLSSSSHSTVALLSLSTPITAIRHRCSSFCTWPTYLPLSPESFSRCRLRWTTPPSPQRPTYLSCSCAMRSIRTHYSD